MRLIDADALMDSIKGYRLGKIPKGELEWKIENAPTVDAVEVVRCKDCKHFDEHASKCYVFCDNEYEVQLEVDRNHFCSYGERGSEHET